MRWTTARDYTKFLNAGGLKGARIGVPRAFYIDRVTLPGETSPRGGINAEQARVMTEAIAVLKQQGAIIVDPADIPSFVTKDANDSFPVWDFCSGGEHAKGKDQNCSINFKYGMKRDYNAWLASLGPSAPVKTLKYPGEGWGLTNDGTNLYMSQGTHVIKVINPEATARTAPVIVVAKAFASVLMTGVRRCIAGRRMPPISRTALVTIWMAPTNADPIVA